MVIKGRVPNQLKTRTKGSVSFHHTADGRTIVHKWPRRRRRPLADITEAQIVRWDKAIWWCKTPEPEAYTLALAETVGSAFYARDIILMETYGNYVSWPGWGRYPQGPAGGEVSYPKGTLKDVDAPFSKSRYRNSGTVTLTLNMWEATTAKLFFSTLAPQHAISKVNSAGVSVPHGKKLWMAEAIGGYSPTSGDGTDTLTWSVPDPAPAQDMIWYWAAHQFDTAPTVHWSTAAYPLPQTGPPPAGAWYLVVSGFISGPAGVPPDPGDVAAQQAAMDALNTCLGNAGAGNIVLYREVKCAASDGMTYSGTTGFVSLPCPPGNWPCFIGSTAPPVATCALPDPSSDTYTWYATFSLGDPPGGGGFRGKPVLGKARRR